MGGRTSTTWKKGQSGNPNGRPPLTPEQRVARSHAAAALGVTKGAGREMVATATLDPDVVPQYVGKTPRERYRAAMLALVPKAVLRLEHDLDGGQERGSTAARFVIEQAHGKATETVKYEGDMGAVKVIIERVEKQLVIPSGTVQGLITTKGAPALSSGGSSGEDPGEPGV